MSQRRGPRPTSERLRRLLVMLPWVMEREVVAVAEVAETSMPSDSETIM